MVFVSSHHCALQRIGDGLRQRIACPAAQAATQAVCVSLALNTSPTLVRRAVCSSGSAGPRPHRSRPASRRDTAFRSATGRQRQAAELWRGEGHTDTHPGPQTGLIIQRDVHLVGLHICRKPWQKRRTGHPTLADATGRSGNSQVGSQGAHGRKLQRFRLRAECRRYERHRDAGQQTKRLLRPSRSGDGESVGHQKNPRLSRFEVISGRSLGTCSWPGGDRRLSGCSRRARFCL